MKTTELIAIFKKYLNEDVRVIVREEIKIAFKELAKEQVANRPKQPVTQNNIGERQTVKKPMIQQQQVQRIVKPIVKTGNPKLDNILVETHKEMLTQPDQPMVDENEVMALLTKQPIPVNNSASVRNMPQQQIIQDDVFETTSQIYETLPEMADTEATDFSRVPTVEEMIKATR